MFMKVVHCINYQFVILCYLKSVKTCKIHTFIIIFLYFSQKLIKMYAIVLAKGFREDLEETNINIMQPKHE